jgi:hypothetical protein
VHEGVSDSSAGVAKSHKTQAMPVKLVARMLGQSSNWSVHLEVATLTPPLTNKLPDNSRKPGRSNFRNLTSVLKIKTWKLGEGGRRIVKDALIRKPPQIEL